MTTPPDPSGRDVRGPKSTTPLPQVTGRGAQINPNNRFLKIQVHEDLEQVEHDEEFLDQRFINKTEYYQDDSKSIVSENDSPDIPFRYSLNAYRGCAHGSTRDGEYNQTEFGQRLRGSGQYADHLRSTFKLFSQRHGLNGRPAPLDTSKFTRPSVPPKKVGGSQLMLFDLDS